MNIIEEILTGAQCDMRRQLRKSMIELYDNQKFKIIIDYIRSDAYWIVNMLPKEAAKYKEKKEGNK